MQTWPAALRTQPRTVRIRCASWCVAVTRNSCRCGTRDTIHPTRTRDQPARWRERRGAALVSSVQDEAFPAITVSLPGYVGIITVSTLLRIMQEENAREIGGVMHCFTETLDVAMRAIEMGFYISFSGIVTFKNATALKEVAQHVALDRILVETDSPYLAPIPFRGKTNQPAYVKHVAEEVARLRNIPLEELTEASTRNFFTLFKRAVPCS